MGHFVCSARVGGGVTGDTTGGGTGGDVGRGTGGDVGGRTGREVGAGAGSPTGGDVPPQSVGANWLSSHTFPSM